jgi:hypothetical protein
MFAKLKKQNTIPRRLSDASYSVDYFARKHDISPANPRAHGEDCRNRDELNAAAARSFGSESADGNL